MSTSEEYTRGLAAAESKAVASHVLWQVFDHGAAAISIVDRDGKFVDVNQQFVEMTGYAREEVIGKNTRILKSGTRAPEEYRELWERVLSGKKWAGDFQNRKKCGEVYWERATISPVLNELGEVEYFVKTAVESTREHDLEDSLKNRNRLLRQITENMEELIGRSQFDFAPQDESEFSPQTFDSALSGQAMREDRLKAGNELLQWKAQLELSLIKMQRVTDELHESRERYERLVRVTNGFVYSVTLDNGQVVGSKNYPGCESVTGYKAEEYNEDRYLWRKTIYPEDLDKVLSQVKDLTEGQPVVIIEHRIIHRDGNIRWLRNTSVGRRNSDDELIGYEGLITDITEFKNSEAERETLTSQLRDMALRDPVTGLMNRWGFEEELKRFWNLALRHTFPIGMLVIDIDHFKTLNDSYGHVVGDRVLEECARLVLGNVRESDAVCRLGGDEFTVILPWSEAEDTRLVANRILEAFRSHTFCKGKHDLRTTVSIGAANLTPGPSFPPNRFLTIADKALYRAKQRGRNRVYDWEEKEKSGSHWEKRTPDILPRERSSAVGRVLVIDDDELIRRLMHQQLLAEDFEVYEADTISAALATLEKERGLFDVALVDLNLGMESGLDLIKQMNELDDSIVSIVVTGEVRVESAVDSLRSGAYDFVQKPIAAAQLVASIKRAIQYRRLMLDNRRYQTHLENMVREKSAAHRRALDRLRRSFRFTLEALVGMLDARERNTGEHSKRVAQMARVLARQMNVPSDEMEAIATGALLHDIGKVAIPDAILMKPGPLNDEEREIMREHPQIGYDMIQASPDLKDAAEIVLSHQEHYDGGGYPRGLKHEEICFGARIFAVADAYDAMRAERPYSTSMSAEEALAEIVRHRGSQFDPTVVDALLTCHEEIERVGAWGEEE